MALSKILCLLCDSVSPNPSLPVDIYSTFDSFDCAINFFNTFGHRF